MEVGNVYWKWNQTFIVGKVGHKWITGLVIEAEGVKTAKAKPNELKPCLYKGKPYPAPKMRGHIRKMKPTTQAAKKMRTQLLKGE
jgi:hypothetical protein